MGRHRGTQTVVLIPGRPIDNRPQVNNLLGAAEAALWSFYIFELSDQLNVAQTLVSAAPRLVSALLIVRICKPAVHYPVCATFTGDSRTSIPKENGTS